MPMAAGPIISPSGCRAEGHPDVAVVNEAYSGDRVLTNGMGTNALSRFDMSVLSHPRVSTVVMMMGINDIGWPGKDAITPSDPEPTAEDIIVGYQQIIERAHDHGLRFVGATLTPFIDTFKGTPTDGYYTPEKEKIREAVNDWIRATSGRRADRLRQIAGRPRQRRGTSMRPMIAAIICIRTTPAIRPWPRPWT